MKKHLELSVKINPTWAEYVSDILINEIGCSGTVLGEIEYKDEEITKDSTNIVKGYLWLNSGDLPDIEKIQSLLWQNRDELIDSGISDKDSLGSWNLTLKEIADEEWAHNWKKFWHPQKVGSKIIICPSWEEYEIKENEIKIILDPGTAFGTGAHPTTRLCITALEKYVKSEDKIADIGTGSGILAIAGAKLGAEKIIGVDNDLSVIEIAKENSQINGVGEKCYFYEGSARNIKEKFEIVVANILANVIIDMMPELINLLKDEGRLILSGINSEKTEEVCKAATDAGINIIEILEEDNWVAIIAQGQR